MWSCFPVALSWFHLGLSLLHGLQGWLDVLWYKVSCPHVSPSHHLSMQKEGIALSQRWWCGKDAAYLVSLSFIQKPQWCFMYFNMSKNVLFQRWHAVSNVGGDHSSQEDQAQHAQWGQRGHSSLMAADVVHQRTDLLTGWSRVVWRERGGEVNMQGTGAKQDRFWWTVNVFS